MTSTCVLDIEENDDFDDERRAKSADGFLYFRYYFDVEPGPGVFTKDKVYSVVVVAAGFYATPRD